MDTSNTEHGAPVSSAASARLSYKYQRLRERLRQAVIDGELSGKLPGERELAKRFNANPKTLSKALTDLAAEGVLLRSIGRGTYVKGDEPTGPLSEKWLLLTDADRLGSPFIQQLLACNAQIEVATAANDLRPSFLSQFHAVIDFRRSTPEELIRDLLVRGVSVVCIGREPSQFKVHAVLLDRAHAAATLARDFFLAGHRAVCVVCEPAEKAIFNAVRLAAERFAPHAAVSRIKPNEIASLVDNNRAAVICDGAPLAAKIVQLAKNTPLSMAAIGCLHDQPPCTGIYVDPAQVAESAAELLRNGQMHRPTTLWLTGTYIDRNTIVASPANLPQPVTALSA